MTQDRIARFEERRERLEQLNDAELKQRFWMLTDQLLEPILELARTHTSPSIERSVLLRMGVDSVSSHGVVQRIMDAGLLGKGAGNVLLRLAAKTGKDIRGTAQAILDDGNMLQGLFGNEQS